MTDLLDGHLDRPCPSCGRTAGRMFCPVLDTPKGERDAGADDMCACIRCGWLGHLRCPLRG